MFIPRRLPLLAVIACLILVAAGALLLRGGLGLPRVSEQQLSEVIHASIQREADTTFVITGYIEVVATVESADTRILLPDLVGVSLGTTRSRARVPGRVAYGFDIEQLTPAMIEVRGDVIEITVPLATIFSAEPDLSRLEVETTSGWARLPSASLATERRAMQLLTDALRQQGLTHLQSSEQPHVNTARALHRLVEPIVVAAGIQNPRFRMYLGEGLVLEP